jgi:ElaB/YqjD/DUF883 family membrane-anchored ribosome-binding protein
MRIQHFLLIVGLSAAAAVPAHAQNPVKKAADDAHHVLKSTGRDIKEDAKATGSATHHVLKKAGNGTKTELGRVTGIHRVGGTVGQAAGDVSRTGKHYARKAKHTVKRKSSAAHRELKHEGNDAKRTIKPER